MNVLKTSLWVLAIFGLTGCGLRFGPGFSMKDKAYFQESPHIVVRSDSYSLRWRYGSWGFYFQPRCKVVDGELLFSLQATSSSGMLTGRYGEIPVIDPKQIQALQNGGAYWLEPDRQKVRLEVIKL